MSEHDTERGWGDVTKDKDERARDSSGENMRLRDKYEGCRAKVCRTGATLIRILQLLVSTQPLGRKKNRRAPGPHRQNLHPLAHPL